MEEHSAFGVLRALQEKNNLRLQNGQTIISNLQNFILYLHEVCDFLRDKNIEGEFELNGMTVFLKVNLENKSFEDKCSIRREALMFSENSNHSKYVTFNESFLIIFPSMFNHPNAVAFRR